jgi:hypothetical protein
VRPGCTAQGASAWLRTSAEIQSAKIFHLSRQRRVRRPPVITRWADEGLQFVIREDAADAAGSIEYYIVRTLADRLLRGLHPSWASYIPAARTGLMLGYKVFISGLLQNLEAESGALARPVLPRPIVDFLQTLNVGTFLFDEDDDNEVISTASDLEAAILGGVVDTESEDEFFYMPAGTQIRLPLHAVSSLVTELSPFVILLRSGVGKTIIFEEPEAHLHLSAQRTLAKALVRLINSGIRIILNSQ